MKEGARPRHQVPAAGISVIRRMADRKSVFNQLVRKTAFETDQGVGPGFPSAPLSSRRILLFLALLTGVVTLAFAGCGGDQASPGPDYDQKLAGSPAPLAALHKQADQLLDGGLPAFQKRLETLKGFPAVVNVWASWCGPCRAEFPHFQNASAKLGKKIAFLAVNPDDDRELAAEFLAANPVPYPSYEDPDSKIASSLKVTRGLPATAFFDAAGNRTYTKLGSYPDLESLVTDIKARAIRGESD